MGSIKKQLTLRPTDEQYKQLMSALDAARTFGHNPALSMNDFILGVVLGNAANLPSQPVSYKPRSVGLTTTTRDIGFWEPAPPLPGLQQSTPIVDLPVEDAPEPDPFIEREFGIKLRQEFPSQHEFLMGQKRQGKAYRAMTNQQKYEYHVKMRQEAGE